MVYLWQFIEQNNKIIINLLLNHAHLGSPDHALFQLEADLSHDIDAAGGLSRNGNTKDGIVVVGVELVTFGRLDLNKMVALKHF